MLNFLNEYWRVILVILSIITFIITIFKLIANSYAIDKISKEGIKNVKEKVHEIKTNHLAHITKDINAVDKKIEDYKEEEKGFKKELKEELHNMYLILRRLERKQVKNSTLIDLLNKKKK